MIGLPSGLCRMDRPGAPGRGRDRSPDPHLTDIWRGRTAGFPTRWIADFPIGGGSVSRVCQWGVPPAGWETRETADLEVCPQKMPSDPAAAINLPGCVQGTGQERRLWRQKWLIELPLTRQTTGSEILEIIFQGDFTPFVGRPDGHGPGVGPAVLENGSGWLLH